MSSIVSRTLLSLMLVLVAGMLAVVALGFLFAALYLGVAQLTGAPMAALITGLAVILLAGLLVLAAYIVMNRKAKVARPAAPAPRQTLGGSLAAELSVELQDLTRKHTFGALTGAVVAGIVLGMSPRLRQDVLRLLQ